MEFDEVSIISTDPYKGRVMHATVHHPDLPQDWDIPRPSSLGVLLAEGSQMSLSLDVSHNQTIYLGSHLLPQENIILIKGLKVQEPLT